MSMNADIIYYMEKRFPFNAAAAKIISSSGPIGSLLSVPILEIDIL